MGIIKAVDLAFEYIRRDEEGNVEGITRAVDGVNLDIKAGDFVAILGHNGSGKSTLAKHLNALLHPTEGTVFVDGKDVKQPENVWDVRQTAFKLSSTRSHISLVGTPKFSGPNPTSSSTTCPIIWLSGF